MNTTELKKVIEFSRDWNDGMSVDEMASKYAIKVSTVRSRVNAFRKQGINLSKRSGARFAFGDKDVAEVNKALK